jgi:hypothetical protein
MVVWAIATSVAITRGDNPPESNRVPAIRSLEKEAIVLSKIWVKTPSFYDGFKLEWKKR